MIPHKKRNHVKWYRELRFGDALECQIYSNAFVYHLPGVLCFENDFQKPKHKLVEPTSKST